MGKKAKKILLLLLSAVLVLPVYILLHELGHLIVMLSAGAAIDEFSIVTAHVSATGGEYTSLSYLWLHANGALLPVFAAYTYMLFYKSNSRNSFYRLFSFMAALSPTTSMFAWLMIPFLYLGGNAPVNDDVTKFLCSLPHGLSPLTVSAVAAMIIGIGIVLMVRKRIIHNFIAEVR